MQDKLVIYYYTINNDVFDSAGNLLGNSVASAFLNNTLDFEIRYVADIDSDNPEEWTKWTGVAGKSVASSLAMDTDYKHAVKGTLTSSLSGAVTSISVSGEETSYTYTGTIELTNSSGQKETVAYTSVVYNNGVYTFTVDTTLTYSYQEGDSIRIPDALILKLEGEDVDDSRAAEGIFSFNMRLLSKKILDNLDFSNVASLSVIAQHKIISQGNIINTFEFPFQINNVLDFGNDTEVVDSPLNTIATKAYVISFSKVKFVYQYSSDGTSWHDNYTTGDLYFRIKNELTDSVWSDAQNVFIGPKGDTGAVYTPSVSSEGVLSWTNNGNLTNPDPVNIKGSKGDKGDPGVMSAVTAYNATTAYTAGALITWGETENVTSCYQVIIATTAGETPATAPSKFQLIASHGTTGAKGDSGNNGTTFTPSVSAEGVLSWANDGNAQNPVSVNIKGPKGDKGDKGDTGDTGFLDEVTVFDETSSGYVAGSVVTYGTPVSTYQVLVTTTTGESPTSAPAKFRLIAEHGATGSTGATGATGSKGDTGATFTPSVSSEGILSWTNNGNLDNPPSISIKGPAGTGVNPRGVWSSTSTYSKNDLVRSGAATWVSKVDNNTGNSVPVLPTQENDYWYLNLMDGTTFTPSVSAAGVLSWTNNGDMENPEAVNIKGPKGDTGYTGDDGATFTPSVSAEGVLSWTNDGGLSNPASVNIRGPKGDTGDTGATGSKGDAGTTFIPSVSSDGTLSWTNDGDLTNPDPVNIKGPAGATGATGAQGAAAISFATLTAITDEATFAGTAQLVNADGTAGETVNIVYDFAVPASGE